MNTGAQGPGWWQASDGAWYPPEAHADPAYRAQHAAFSGPTGVDQRPGNVGTLTSYPARLTVETAPTIARWRVFLHGIMLFPHMIVSYLIGIVANVCMILAWFAILFTGKMPEGLHNIIAMSRRYTHRMMGYALFYTEEYPPFDFETTAHDATPYPIRADYDYDSGDRNRVTVFFRYFMVLPHMFVLAFVIIGAYLAYIVQWFAVLFTGKVPSGTGDFLIGVGRWVNRVTAYFSLLTDEYPPFSLD